MATRSQSRAFFSRPRCIAAAVIALASLGAAAPAQTGPDPATVLSDVSTQSSQAPASETRPIGPRRAADSAGIAARQDAQASSVGILKTGVSLATVVSLIFACAMLLKRFSRRGGGLAAAFGPGGPSPAGVLEVLGRYPVAPGQCFILLRCERRILLLAQNSPRFGRGGAGSITPLTEITDPEEAASIISSTRHADGESIAAKFTSLLSRFGGPAEPQSPFDDAPGRNLVAETDEGDRAEVWSDGREPVRTPASRPASAPAPIDDAVGSLRRRLETMKSAGVGA
ncbi:MAG: flagellar biosynthetic protein FliO [Phycisphaeraceae bacterium]|nr:flagellar biosynthetic protein FliO [Phycisphaeraceae bacterium]